MSASVRSVINTTTANVIYWISLYKKHPPFHSSHAILANLWGRGYRLHLTGEETEDWKIRKVAQTEHLGVLDSCHVTPRQPYKVSVIIPGFQVKEPRHREVQWLTKYLLDLRIEEILGPWAQAWRELVHLCSFSYEQALDGAGERGTTRQTPATPVESIVDWPAPG